MIYSHEDNDNDRLADETYRVPEEVEETDVEIDAPDDDAAPDEEFEDYSGDVSDEASEEELEEEAAEGEGEFIEEEAAEDEDESIEEEAAENEDESIDEEAAEDEDGSIEEDEDGSSDEDDASEEEDDEDDSEDDEDEKRPSRVVDIILYILIALVLLLLGFFFGKSEYTYEKGKTALEDGRYRDAVVTLDDLDNFYFLGTYRDSDKLRREALIKLLGEAASDEQEYLSDSDADADADTEASPTDAVDEEAALSEEELLEQVSASDIETVISGITSTSDIEADIFGIDYYTNGKLMYDLGMYNLALECFDHCSDDYKDTALYKEMCEVKLYSQQLQEENADLSDQYDNILDMFREITAGSVSNSDAAAVCEDEIFHIVKLFGAVWKDGDSRLSIYRKPQCNNWTTLSLMPWDAPTDNVQQYLDGKLRLSEDYKCIITGEGMSLIKPDGECWFTVTGFSESTEECPQELYVKGSDGVDYTYTLSKVMNTSPAA